MTARTAEALLSNTGLTLLEKNSYSYGAYLDRLIAGHAPRVVYVSQDSVGMARIIAARRVDYMFIAAEEGEAVLAQPAVKDLGLALVRLSDIPRESPRYLLCSKQTGRETIEKLTRAIRQVVR